MINFHIKKLKKKQLSIANSKLKAIKKKIKYHPLY